MRSTPADESGRTALLDEGWRPPQASPCSLPAADTPEQVARQELLGQGGYWSTFWDDEQVFYGHVLGFKGLERRVVVLVLNEGEPKERAKERLYVGLSRARDCLVVVGDPAYVERVGGSDLLRRLTRGESDQAI